VRSRSLRRTAVAVVVVPLLVAAVGCSSSKSKGGTPSGTGSSASAGTSAGTSSNGPLPTIEGAINTEPTIKVPAGKPPADIQVKVLTQGHGTPVGKGDFAQFDYTIYDWDTHKLIFSSYKPHQPAIGPIGVGQGLQAWDTALLGQKTGSRILVVAPPSTTFKGQGDAQDGIGKNDTLVMVLDLTNVYPANSDITGKQPTMTDPSMPIVTGDPGSGKLSITIPKTQPPTTLTSKVLIQGNGPTVAAGQTLLAQYEGIDWNTGKVFDSTFDPAFKHQQVATFTIGKGQVIPGWDKTLVGQKVGSRVLLVIPPAEGYGPQGGNPDAGIGKNDTLVFVVDVVGAV
jgi:peptidylprolyl isomerase